MQQLPYKGEVRISWFVTAWCNYSCHYCFTLVFHKRAADGAKQYHAFDHYPADAWSGALRSLPYSRINLNCTGGEVMLDRKNMLSALTGLVADPRFEISITTNGTFDPAYFGSLDKRNIYLTLSFHPSETSLDQFARRAAALRDAGFKVAMINMVIDPKNIDVFERAIGQLEADGFFVNVGTMLPAGEYWSRSHTRREERELDLLERYNTPLDLYYKVAEPPSKGRLCYYPARSFSLMPDGLMSIYCTDISRNLFTEGPPELPTAPQPCQYDRCIGCNDMFRSLTDEPMVQNSAFVHNHRTYADEVMAWRRTQKRRQQIERLPGGDWLARRLFGDKGTPVRQHLRSRQQADARIQAERRQSLLSIDSIRPALPPEPIFGAMDVFPGEVRSRDRIQVTGWAASRDRGAPVKEVRLSLDSHELCTVSEFHDRPDIARQFGRAEFEQSGWRTLVFLPSLEAGEYPLAAQAIGLDGQAVTIRTQPLRVIR